MNTIKIPFARVFKGKDIGCILDGSASSANCLNQRIIDFAVRYGFDLDDYAIKLLARFEYDVTKDDDSQILSEIADEAVSYLNDSELPSYCYFTVDDNSLFLSADVENAREDVGFVSSRKDYPDDDYEGEWLHVNNHGNATLFCRYLDNDGKICDDVVWSA